LDKHRGIHSVTKGILGTIIGKELPGKTFQHGFTTDFYTIAERSRINKIIEEQNFSHSGLVDGKQAAELGKILGVDVVISGTTELTTEKKRYHYETKKGKKVYYFKNEATATLSMRIVRVNTGNIIGQKVATSTVIEMADKKPMDVVREGAINSAASDLVFYFAPSFRLQKIKFQVLKSKQYKNDGKKAIKFLGRDELPESLAIYTSIVDEDPYNHKAIYMQGVLYELACNYDKALERYNMAYQIYDESKDYHQAIERVEGQKALWKQLNKIGIQMTVMDLSLSEEEITDAGKQEVKLKGNSKIRIPVYASLSKGEVIMKVPGGISLEIISKEKDFYKVKLITGEEGYIHIKDAK
jgi:tetratricopeptide (TPR) repeat protein